MVVHDEGIKKVGTKNSFIDTLSKLDLAIAENGLIVFTKIKFSEDADRVGLKMNPTQLFIFGHPKGGTPLMQASPTLAIDFPLKILVQEDDDGKVWLLYNTSKYLYERHNIPIELVEKIPDVGAIAQMAAD